MKWAIMALLLLLSPMAHGISCNNVDGDIVAQCNEIKSSTLAEPEKQHLLNGLAYPSSSTANHSFVYDWNTKIQFTSAPDGVKIQNSGSIKDAWMKIISIMPSVMSKDKLLTSGIGTIQTAYNYRIEMPSGTEGGDCRTDYSLRSNNAMLNIYLNDNLIGNSRLTDFQVSSTLNFKARLKIQSVIEVNHHRNSRECCYHNYYERCTRYCDNCRFSGTDTRVDELNLEDGKVAYQHWPVIKPQIRGVDNYHNTYVGILNISNFDAFRLLFENSSLSQSNYYYDADLSISPYNVLTLRANNFTRKTNDNLNFQQAKDNYKFYVSNPKGCKIIFYSHFSTWEQDCNLKFDFPEIDIETDKLQYNPKEAIRVTIEPKNTLVKVRYGDEEKTAENEVQFEAKASTNKITLSYNDREIEKVIHVKNEDTWNFAFNFGVFSSVIYAIYFAIKKSWGALL